MATITLGTAATTTLIGLVWKGTSTAEADVAAINAHIKDDLNVAHPMASIGGVGGFSLEGKLYIPNRGFINVLAGDLVAYDPARGGVILVTKYSAAGASWVHT